MAAEFLQGIVAHTRADVFGALVRESGSLDREKLEAILKRHAKGGARRDPFRQIGVLLGARRTYMRTSIEWGRFAAE